MIDCEKAERPALAAALQVSFRRTEEDAVVAQALDYVLFIAGCVESRGPNSCWSAKPA